MALKLSSYEGQAKLSIALAVIGGLAALVAVGLVYRNFDRASFYVSYNPHSAWLPLVGLGLMTAVAAGAIGFFIALNSAGQRRNPLSALAWQAFFLNAIVLTVVLATAVFLVFTRNPIEVRPG